jgi:hypothetical protein
MSDEKNQNVKNENIWRFGMRQKSWKTVIIILVLLFLTVSPVFAADYDADFDKELSKNNLAKAEDILRKRSDKMDLASRLQRIILGNIKGFNSNNAITVAQILIRYGANVNAVKRVLTGNDYYYEAPLLYITVNSSGLDREQTVQMINLLCRSGANPDARNTIGVRYTALMIANNKKLEWNMAYTKALIENGANVNLKDNDGNTALMINIDEFDVFKYLVENKADLNIRNEKGQTALILAAEEEKTDVLTYLVEHGANVNLRDNNGLTAASICYDKGQINLYTYLKEHGAIDFEPRQVVQQAAPAQSTTNVYVQPSAPAQSAPAAPAAPRKTVYTVSVYYLDNNVRKFFPETVQATSKSEAEREAERQWKTKNGWNNKLVFLEAVCN